MFQPDFSALHIFVTMAQEGTMSKAAQALHLTQPAISLQLKNLQERLQIQLFERSGRNLLLTRDGAALLPQAQKALAALKDFSHSAQGLQAAVRGRLRIGTILDPEFIRLGAFLKALVERAPHIETELSQHISGDVLSRVCQSSLDVGFYLATPAELAQIQAQQSAPTEAAVSSSHSFNPYLYENQLQEPIYPSNWPLAGEKSARIATNFVAHELTRFHYRVIAPSGWGPQVLGRDWRALAQLPWIITPPASAHHRLLSGVLQTIDPAQPSSSQRLQLRRAALVDQEASMLDLVRSGVGLSLARDTLALHEAQTRGLVIADRVQLECCLCFIHSASLQSHNQPQPHPQATIQAALEALQQVWR